MAQYSEWTVRLLSSANEVFPNVYAAYWLRPAIKRFYWPENAIDYGMLSSRQNFLLVPNAHIQICRLHETSPGWSGGCSIYCSEIF